ncbi:hypothetical protein COHA_002655 [Chlorella ohadii]|uniref:type I protein arginine methyltransferase n=1 Tax=Chlorella ohadii TaxID=2649997 RepID=A0AAD5H8K0_9CHLO|nr:hypothetical protein COHA_002655 [Chlorella ohadii]
MGSDGNVSVRAALSALVDEPGAAALTTAEQAVAVRLQRQPDGAPVLEVMDEQGAMLNRLPLADVEVWRAGSSVLMVRAPAAKATFVLRTLQPADAAALQRLHDDIARSSSGSSADGTARPQDAQQPAAGEQRQRQGGGSHFDQKTEKGSADLYFHYYGCLMHQQNMLQDYIRTGTYFAAITENPADFEGKAVMDVGCGSGILSLFAAQAGARVVYAVEASNMAHYARQLAAANPGIGDRIKVLHGKVEEVEVPEKVDVLVSEPMGTLLVNERMIESYLYARDKFLKPGGKMFPRLGRVHVCAFSDETLMSEVVVDQIPPNVLVSNCVSKTFDFLTISEQELYEIVIPLSLQVAVPCTVHGIASWFDVLFDGSQTQRWLSTAPGLPVTHWFQLRCLMEQPVVVAQPGATVSGELRLVAHARQSYDVHVTLRAPPLTPGGPPQESKGKFDLKEPYYRQQMQWMMQMAAAAPTAADAGAAAAAESPAVQAAAAVMGVPQHLMDTN